MNRIVLVGRLESTPELRHTSTGIPVANFSLSVRRSIPNGQGRYERDIFRVVTWRKLAETCCRFLERGRMIAVDGKLQNRILQSPNGDRRIIVEIHADDVRFLEGAKPRNDVDAGRESETGDTGTAEQPVKEPESSGESENEVAGKEPEEKAVATMTPKEDPFLSRVKPLSCTASHAANTAILLNLSARRTPRKTALSAIVSFATRCTGNDVSGAEGNTTRRGGTHPCRNASS